jgi:metallophosphoesterase (TIGR03767 family)
MDNLSRRDVLRFAAAAVPMSVLSVACSKVATSPSGTPTTRPGTPKPPTVDYEYSTLVQTMARRKAKGYQPIVTGPGEPFIERALPGAAAGADRASHRRSLLYFGQVSDTHMVDAQTPARADFAFPVLKDNGAFRPQEAMTVQVLSRMVAAMNEMRESPVTKAPMAVAVVTGDYADSQARNEMTWHVDILDGRSVVPDSGKPKTYEGVQAWQEATYAYHPDNPTNDFWGKYGYPRFPGLLQAAVSTTVESDGLEVPWLTVLGNHDSTFMGTLLAGATDPTLQKFAAGDIKIALIDPLEIEAIGTLYSPDNPADMRKFAALYKEFPSQPHVHTVASDADRVKLTTQETIGLHFDTSGGAGPVGHGFTQASRTTGKAWWSNKVGPAVTFLGLDTTNHVYGTDGCIVDEQFGWIEEQLIAGSSSYYDTSGQLVHGSGTDTLFVLLSHHPSWMMDNLATDPQFPVKPHDGADLTALVLRFPNVILWVNGHTHANTIVPHPGGAGQGPGFWEVNSPSTIDWGQQGRLIDLVDNRDGTLSIFTITIDHHAPADPGTGSYTVESLASISRQLSANVWWNNPDRLLGKPEDRNTELIMKAPFDIAKVTNRDLAFHQFRSAVRSASRVREKVTA